MLLSILCLCFRKVLNPFNKIGISALRTVKLPKNICPGAYDFVLQTDLQFMAETAEKNRK